MFLFFRHFYSPEFLSFVSAVSEVSGAGAFAGYHAGADGAFRRAHRSESTAVGRLLFAAQDGTAFTGFVIRHAAVNQVEMLFSVEVTIASESFNADLGTEPSPRHSKLSRSAKTSSIIRMAFMLPSGRTAR